jgi:hypothetical protein
VYAGLLGAVHGYFETLQGNAAPAGIVINAIGAPCRGDMVWHACLPAMTLIPSFRITGVLAILVSLAVLVWAAAFVQRRRGGLVLILLSIMLLLVGGGFIPPTLGIIAGMVATRVNAPFTRWRARLSPNTVRFLAKLWPWSLVAYVAWVLPQWIVGRFFNEFMLKQGFLVSILTNGLLLLSIFTAFAHDIHSDDDFQQR